MSDVTENGNDKQRGPVNYDQRAYRSLQAARKLRERQDWTPDAQSDFLLQQANVFALLELADAIRSSNKS
jgi:hypothetical protein